MTTLLPAVAKERDDGTVLMSFGDPVKGPHEQFDFHGSIELAQSIADAYTICHSPADLEPIPDDSLHADRRYLPLIQALSRMAGNRQSDGTSSLVSRDDREAIIHGCNDLLISARQPPPPSTHVRVDVEAEIASVVQSVNEWDDRTSPDDYPEHLLITSEELTEILRTFAATLEGSDNG